MHFLYYTALRHFNISRVTSNHSAHSVNTAAFGTEVAVQASLGPRDRDATLMRRDRAASA